MGSNGTGSVRCHRAALPAGLLAIALSTGLFGVAASGAEEGMFLSKPDVERLLVGKTFEYVRATDGTTVKFDVREGGKVYYAPPRTMRNLSIQGTYTVEEDGGLCFKWENTTKYITMTDSCYRFKRDGDKVHVVGHRNPERVIGDLVE